MAKTRTIRRLDEPQTNADLRAKMRRAGIRPDVLIRLLGTPSGPGKPDNLTGRQWAKRLGAALRGWRDGS